MYDATPWLIDRQEAKRRGLAQPGWYVMSHDGQPLVGPCEGPEECILALKKLNIRRHQLIESLRAAAMVEARPSDE
jgi:hypothetical protein